jgi:hypothetical protein
MLPAIVLREMPSKLAQERCIKIHREKSEKRKELEGSSSILTVNLF